MSHPAHSRPRLLGSPGGPGGRMVSQEILMGTTAADETPPIGTLRQSPLLGNTSSASSPKGHTHPQLTALITARPICLPGWKHSSVTAADPGEGGVLTVPGERLWENGPGFESRWVL